MTHPFRPPISMLHPQSTRSTETPMEFVYEKPQSSSSYLQSSDHHQSVKLSNLNNINKQFPPQSRPITKSNTSSLSIPPAAASPEPPRKRMHHETESMDWETTQPNHKPNLFPDPASTRPLGGTFLFNPPSSLPLPPVYTHPSSVPPPSLPSLPSPDKFRPESYGLYASHRNVHPEDHDADSSLDVEHVVLQPNHSSKMYSNNAVKHENRRRTRTQRQVRSKLSQLSFDSDHDEEDKDSDVEVISNQNNNNSNHALVRKSNHSKNRQDRSLDKKRSETTTNNYLTINGWKDTKESNRTQNQSHLSTDTPYILLVYLQLLFNSSLVVVGLYLAINLILIIRADINHKIIVHTSKLRHEIELCTKEYSSNRCFPIDQRTKFIEKHCIEWEACMNRDPNLISRSKIGAETFAEVMNGFVDMISWKTMLFIFLSIGAGIYATNLAMNSYKSKWEPHHHNSTTRSPWRTRFLSRSDQPKEQPAPPHTSVDPNEIFGPITKNFIDHNHPSSSYDSRKNR